MGQEFLTLFSSPIRVEILFLLRDQPLSLSELSEKLGQVSKSEVSRHLARLADKNLVEKEGFSSRNHTLTPFGRSILPLISPLNFINKNEKYFKRHSLTDLPLELIRRIDELKAAKMVNGAIKAITTIKESLDATENELWAMYSSAPPFNNEKICKAKLIVKPDYYKTEVIPRKNEHQMPNLLRKNVEFRLIYQITVGMAILDQKTAFISFPRRKEESTDLKTLFVVTDPVGLQYVKDIWEYFWEQAKRPDG
ncbi:MAG: helix-turn-helix transcriptional regulator [Promethearchaeota archaeon]